MATAKVRRVLAVLNVAEVSVHDFIGKVTAIPLAMTGNKAFPTPNPSLATVTTHNNALEGRCRRSQRQTRHRRQRLALAEGVRARRRRR